MAVEVSYHFPLRYPTGYNEVPMHARRYDNGFPQNLTIDQAIGYLEMEINIINPVKATIYSGYDRLNVERLRRKGDRDNSGIVCELGFGTTRYFVVCDTWRLIEHNLYAIHLALRAVKNIEKWGVAKVTQTLSAFNNSAVHVMAANNGQMAEWMHVLGLGPTATLDDANAVYRARAKMIANDEDALLEINRAIEQARAALSGMN